MGSYNQRGLCVRIICPPGIKDKIDRAKFITREDKSFSGPGFSWEKSFGYCTFDEFYDHVESQLQGFEWPELPGKYWDGINQYIERLNYKYGRIDDIDQWTHTHLTEFEMEKELSKLSSGNSIFVLLQTIDHFTVTVVLLLEHAQICPWADNCWCRKHCEDMFRLVSDVFLFRIHPSPTKCTCILGMSAYMNVPDCTSIWTVRVQSGPYEYFSENPYIGTVHIRSG